MFGSSDLKLDMDGTNTSQLRDNSTFDPAKKGDNTIDFTEKRHRIVEWRDGNGVEHQESASGLVVLSTQWGDYRQEISELPRVNHFDVSLELPNLLSIHWCQNPMKVPLTLA